MWCACWRQATSSDVISIQCIQQEDDGAVVGGVVPVRACLLASMAPHIKALARAHTLTLFIHSTDRKRMVAAHDAIFVVVSLHR